MRIYGGAMIAAALAAAACGGAQQTGGGGQVAGFACKGRRIEYTVAGGLAGVENGVSVICQEPSPMLKKWRAAGGGEQAESNAHSMTQSDFEELWKKIESTGWRNLENCSNPAAGDQDPVYTVDVSDDKSSVSLSCPGQASTMPFPFDRLINELDLAAGGFPE